MNPVTIWLILEQEAGRENDRVRIRRWKRKAMGDVVDLEEFRKRRAREEAKARGGKSGRSGRGRKRERKAPLSEPAAREDDGEAGTDDDQTE